MRIAKRPDSRQGAIRLVFRGRGLDRAFLEFTAERARRLALSGWVEEGRAGEVTVVVSGSIALADALEMACMLGPLHCLVDAVERSEEPESSVRRSGFLMGPPGRAERIGLDLANPEPTDQNVADRGAQGQKCP